MMKRTCTQTKTLFDAYLLDTLSERQRRRVAAHVDACPQCRELLGQVRARLAQLDAVAPIEPPVGLAERTLARIAEEEAQQTSAPGFWNRERMIFAVAALVVILLLPTVINEVSNAAASRAMADNLKRFALVYKMYANESPGEVYPPVAEYDGVWVPDLRGLYPKYIQDVKILAGPAAPPQMVAEMEEALERDPPDYERAMRLMAKTYVYHGWIMRDAEDVEEIKRFQIAGGPRDSSIMIEDGDNIYRLREGVERFLITDINNPGASAMAQSTIPIMVARPQTHRPDDGPLTPLWRRFKRGAFGISPPLFAPTLYMDGHVEFVAVDDAPPNIRAMLDLFPEEAERYENSSGH